MGGEPLAASTPDLRATWGAVVVAARCLLQSVHRLAEIYGWDIDGLEDWIDEFDQRSAEIERDVTQGGADGDEVKDKG
jgi:hypothetical protein